MPRTFVRPKKHAEIPYAPTRTRRLTVIAQDPSVRRADGRILTTEVEVPAEGVEPGPWGYRVQVIDYDGSTGVLYKPREYKRDKRHRRDKAGDYVDPFVGASNGTLLDDPTFHAQNVYGLAMRVLWRFEFALGRRVSWSFTGHQLKVAPHAFADANAFYSPRDEALLFGYFPGARGRMVFSCLSHDVVAHEATHALLDGLRVRYQDPSSPDQAAFHEGFSDLVALLSVFSLRDVVATVLTQSYQGERTPKSIRDSLKTVRDARPLIPVTLLTSDKLKASLLFGLAEQMGSEMSGLRGQALRRSVKLDPSPAHLGKAEFQEPHRRGEILVAAVLNAFVEVLGVRFASLGKVAGRYLDLGRVIEDAADAADHLLTMVIRAIDYSLPVHMEFRDYLCALLTADYEIRPVDAKYKFRDALRKSFKAYGIEPSAAGGPEDGLWLPPEKGLTFDPLTYDRTHFESMRSERDEVFRFVWENQKQLRVTDGVYTRVLSVRPCLRINPDDGFALRESVAEYYQEITVRGDELRRWGLRKPRDMPNDTPVKLYGGGTLIFDEYGRLKFNLNNRLDDAPRQQERVDHLWRSGAMGPGAMRLRRFSHIHRRRAMNAAAVAPEQWLGPATDNREAPPVPTPPEELDKVR